MYCEALFMKCFLPQYLDFCLAVYLLHTPSAIRNVPCMSVCLVLHLSYSCGVLAKYSWHDITVRYFQPLGLTVIEDLFSAILKHQCKRQSSASSSLRIKELLPRAALLRRQTSSNHTRRNDLWKINVFTYSRLKGAECTAATTHVVFPI